MREELTQEYVKNRFEYDEITGVFTWKNPSAKRKCLKGRVVGGFDRYGYLSTGINKKHYRLHRLAWLYVYGKNPDGDIDHINGIKSDNRIENLREVSCTENQQNRKCANVNNKSGLLGVSKEKRYGKWIAQIGVNGKCIYLGRFDDMIAAHESYLNAKRKLHTACTI